MTPDDRSWISAGLDESAWRALASGLAGSELWSLLMEVLAARAVRRTPASLRQQWKSDRFVQPCEVDQRRLHELDGHLFTAARAFEAIELSPLAPLGVCSSVALASQNKIVSTARGTEVVSDPTNVLAMECERRLREMPDAEVRLATSHRCVRAQAVPRVRGFAAHFRIFCLASAAHERGNRAFLSSALIEHINTHLAALDRLARNGYTIEGVNVRILATAANEELAVRIAQEVHGAPVERQPLAHPYYDGIRFMIDVNLPGGGSVPLADGGAFDWLRRLASHRKLTFVASGMGAQLMAHLMRAG